MPRKENRADGPPSLGSDLPYEYGKDPAAGTGLMEVVYMFIMGGMFSLILICAAAAVLLLWLTMGVPMLYSSLAIPVLLGIYSWATTFSHEDKNLKGFRPEVRNGPFIATICNYFPIKMIIPESVQLDPNYVQDSSKTEGDAQTTAGDDDLPDHKYIIGVHPHGIHSLGATSLIYEGGEFYRRFPRISRNLHGAVASVLFRVPFVRELFLQAGYQAADRKVLDGLLARGKSIYIILGGSAESIRTETGKDKVWLHKREGFIRLALKHGARLVPSYTFYMTDVYSVWYGPIQAFREWLVKKF